MNLSYTTDHLLEHIASRIGYKLDQLWLKAEQKRAMMTDFDIVHWSYLMVGLCIFGRKKKQGGTQLMNARVGVGLPGRENAKVTQDGHKKDKAASARRANCFHKSYKWVTTTDDNYWTACSSSQTHLSRLPTE